MSKHNTAAAAYADKAAQIAEQLATLQAALAAHAERQSFNESTRGNWGFAGDLGAVLAQLTEANRMLGA